MKCSDGEKAERAAFLEERRKADVEAMLALLPTTPPVSSSTATTTAPLIEDEPLAGPSSPLPRNSWTIHRPSSPSPLSPSHKLRTPKPHSASKRRVKTPLSRLVLEKAVRQKGKDTATALELERLGGVLGESGRKGNDVKGKGKLRSTSGIDSGMRSSMISNKGGMMGSSMRDGNTLKSSVNLGMSSGGNGLGRSMGRPEKDLSKSDGVGPKGVAAKRIWR